MPLARYFVYVGGTLLALLIMLNLYLPKPAETAVASDVQRPVVRIHSDQKLPERIVIDTSIPTIVPPPVKVVAAPAKGPALDALAQAAPSDVKASEPAKPEPKLPPKRKVAKRQVHQPVIANAQWNAQRPVVYAQAPQFNFFGPMLR
jgi:uncharacterized membrane protein